MYKPVQSDIVMLRTDTMVAWLRRPTVHHANWWIAYYSTNADEAIAWDMAIKKMKDQLNPFHQGVWPIDHEVHHPDCKKPVYGPDFCPGVVQAWEMWLGCSDWAREEPASSLEDIREYGDPALEKVLVCFKVIMLNVATLLKSWEVEISPTSFIHPALEPISV